MDLNMPIMNGFDATTHIMSLMKEYANSKVNIVALTAYANEENIDQCHMVGMCKVLNKPVSMEDLEDALNKYYYAE